MQELSAKKDNFTKTFKSSIFACKSKNRVQIEQFFPRRSIIFAGTQIISLKHNVPLNNFEDKSLSGSKFEPFLL